MRARRWWMLGVTCLSVVVVGMDLTILNIALPAISAALHAGTHDLQWLVDAYSLVFAGVIVPAGMFGDRLGRKRMLLAGLAVFLAASLWCALSVSAGELTAARAALGLGGGIVFPLALAVVSAAFGDDERPKAIGILIAGVALGLPLGPVLGGFLLQHFSWHSVFWINVPAAGATLVAGIVLMPESRNPAAPRLDAPGALLSAAAIVCMVWGLINGPEDGWTAAPTWGLLAGSAVLVAAFALRERFAADKLIDPALLRDRRFCWGTAASVAVSFALFAIMFFVPQYLQSVAGDGPLSAGLRLIPTMAGLLVVGAAADQIVRAAGTRLTVAAGLVLLAAGLIVLSQIHLSTGYPYVAAGLALCGLGIGASMAASMNAVMAAVGGDEAGIGASANQALRQVGGAVAVAVLGGLLSAVYARDLRPALTALTARDAATARASITQAMQVASRLPSGGASLRAAAAAAFLHGMSLVMLSCAGVAAVAVLTSGYLPGRAAAGATGDHRAAAPGSPPRDPAGRPARSPERS
jgi:EmrB/QacA subfamily drug resistance transporter